MKERAKKFADIMRAEFKKKHSNLLSPTDIKIEGFRLLEQYKTFFKVSANIEKNKKVKE